MKGLQNRQAKGVGRIGHGKLYKEVELSFSSQMVSRNSPRRQKKKKKKKKECIAASRQETNRARERLRQTVI